MGRRPPATLTARSLALALCLECGLIGVALAIGRVEGRPKAHAVRSAVVPAPAEVTDTAALVSKEPAEPAEPIREQACDEPALAETEVDAAPRFEDLLLEEPVVTAALRRATPDAWLVDLKRSEPRRPQPPAPERPAALPRPLPGLNVPPPYPRRAIRLGQKGTVGLDLRLDPHGRVAAVTVEKTSGSALLDLVARKALARWRFDRGPARVSWTIEFRLGGAGPEVSGERSSR